MHRRSRIPKVNQQFGWKTLHGFFHKFDAENNLLVIGDLLNDIILDFLVKIFAVVVLCSLYEMIHKNFESGVSVAPNPFLV